VREPIAMLPRRARVLLGDESAQSAAEYLGVLLVVAAIITAIAWTDPGQAISGKLSELVHDVAGDR
jgi:hypothetical protein